VSTPEAQDAASQAGPSAPDGTLTRLVVRNTFYLTASQALTVPLSVLVNAMLARYLGPSDFGVLYLSATLAGFGFLAVNWGHEGALPALVSLDRSVAGALLGSSIFWRAGFSFVAYALFAVVCHFLHYGPVFQWALALTFVINAFTSFIAGCKDTIRGFERTDIPAITHVGQQLLTAALIVPVLLLGGGMLSTLVAQIPVCILVLVLIGRALRPVGVGKLTIGRTALMALFVGGTPFVVSNLVMALQPIIDALYLSKLAPTEVMGWFAASRRLIGVLLFPATSLVGALFPTLCRLYNEDKQGFANVARGAFKGVALLAAPVAVGCAVFPELGVAIYNRGTFGQAENNLRVSSAYLFLVYFSMPLGTCILAAGRKRAWSIVQALCVGFSLVLDPLLVPWFQRKMGNGGLGPCVAAVAAEVMVVGVGIALTPKGVFDRGVVKTLLLAMVSGAAMALVAHLCKSITPWVVAPLSLVAYVVAALVTGAIEKEQLAAGKAFVQRKVSRGR